MSNLDGTLTVSRVQPPTRPAKNRCYGITHDLDGAPRVIEPKTVKVGIGLAKGPWLHVYIDRAGKWAVQVGKQDITRFDTKTEARKFYRQAKPPERAYPQRLPYFTFSHISGVGSLEPDWDIIESHGPIPTEIDIVFVHDDPLNVSYQYWTAAEKKCEGDGINAMRVCSMATTPNEKRLAEAAQQSGEKYFPIIGGCWTKGCQYSKPQGNDRSPCAPHGRLLFQLINSPRLGGTAYFDTRGFRSCSQLFSCLEIFRGVTGGGNADRGFVAGIPLKLILRPYKTSFNGRSATQYGVSLEFRADSALALKQKLIGHGVQFRIASAAPDILSLPAAPPQDPGRELPEESAAVINAEFDRSIPPEDPPPGQDAGFDDEADLDGAGGALAGAWDEGDGAHTPDPISAAAPLSQEISQFYGICRAHGMNDTVILEHLGSCGYETPAEVPDSAIPELMKWANSYRTPTPRQRT
jgi:hypothetical protein